MPDGHYFVIRSKLNGFVLDVQASGCAAGTKVISWPHHGGDNQLWYKDRRTGTIRTKLNGMCLDLSGNRAKINHFQCGDADQQWKIKCEYIFNRQNHCKVIDIVQSNCDRGADICAWKKHGGNNQKWCFEFNPPKYFYIVSKLHCKVIDVEGQNKCPGARVIMWHKKSCHDDNQLWYENKHGIIASKLNDLVLDGSGGRIVMAEFSKCSRHQRWLIDGNKIINKHNHDEVLDIARGNRDDRAEIIPYKFHGGANQLWTIEYI